MQILQWGSPWDCCTSSPCWGVRKECPVPTGAGVGVTKAGQQGKPPVKLLQHPREKEEFLLHPKAPCAHSKASSPFKELTPAKPFAAGCGIQVSPPLLQSMFPVEPRDPPTCGIPHPAPLLRTLLDPTWALYPKLQGMPRPQLPFHLRDVPDRALPAPTPPTEGAHHTSQGCEILN